MAAAFGLGLALCGILIGATGFSASLPFPEWILAAGALAGLSLSVLAGIRLLSIRTGSGPRRMAGSTATGDWIEMSRALEAIRSGRNPGLEAPDGADEGQRLAYARANETFQFLARRQKVVRAALDELCGELNNYYRYLTKSQVGLIGANSVAERLEKFEERLAKIRSAV